MVTLKDFNHTFEWSHLKITTTDSKVRTTLYSIKKQYHRKVLLSSFHVSGHTDFKVNSHLAIECDKTKN